MEGITYWHNKGNRFHVIQLHYTADPDKNPNTKSGRAFIELAKQGMPTKGFKREYEIDWASGAGEPVYPDFSAKQIAELRWHREWIIYRGWDRGFNRPACHWSCIDNEDRWLWLYEEMGNQIYFGDFLDYCQQVTIAKFPNAMIIDYFPVDTKIQSDATDKDEKSPLSIAQSKGMAPIIPVVGVKDGLDIIRRKMMLRQDGKYGMLVDPSCKICIEGLLGGYHCNPKDSKADEPVKDGYYEHLMDAARYTASGLFLLTGEGPGVATADFEPEYQYNPVTGFIEG
jgi:hypothetical protein